MMAVFQLSNTKTVIVSHLFKGLLVRKFSFEKCMCKLAVCCLHCNAFKQLFQHLWQSKKKKKAHILNFPLVN